VNDERIFSSRYVVGWSDPKKKNQKPETVLAVTIINAVTGRNCRISSIQNLKHVDQSTFIRFVSRKAKIRPWQFQVPMLASGAINAVKLVFVPLNVLYFLLGSDNEVSILLKQKEVSFTSPSWYLRCAVIDYHHPSRLNFENPVSAICYCTDSNLHCQQILRNNF
jgi:hypothetical protein